MKFKTFYTLCLLFLCLYGKTQTQEDFAKTITSEELSRHLHVIASDEMEGRETGKEGQKKAAKYIADHFASIGIEPINGSYYQEIPLLLKKQEGMFITINGKRFEFMKDFYINRGFNDTIIKTNQVTFLGYGIDHKNYSDYRGVDVKGKVLMVFTGEPNKKGKSWLTNSKELTDWGKEYRQKLKKAKKEKAAAIFFIADNISEQVEKLRHHLETPFMMLDIEDYQPARYLPNFFISLEMAEAIFVSRETSIKKEKAKIDKKGNPISLELNAEVEINVNRIGDKIKAENVLGYIEGSDKKDEVIIISAHYDHIGMDGKEIYNGADDDGSGTVALLEIAQAFMEAKKSGNGPRRSILILPVSGEEKGLLGSSYYVKNPVFPLENTVADLNIDMIGRIDEQHKGNPDYIYLIGADMLSSELHQISEEANTKYSKLQLDYTYNMVDDPNQYYYRSDHYNFAKNNIPVIFYFNGTHADYHKPTDTVDKIDFNKMEKITRLVFHTAWELSNREERIKVDKVKK